MKKNNKLFIGLFVGIVLGFITFKVNANVTYNSDGVLYKKGTENITVTNALDELKGYLNYGNATAENITKGKTVIVNGKKITGTGEDTAKETVKILTNYYQTEMKSYTYKTAAESSAYYAYHSPAQSHDARRSTGTIKGHSDPIYLYKDPNGNYGLVTAIIFDYNYSSGAEWETVCSSSGILDVSLKTEKGKVLDNIHFTSNQKNTKTFTPSDYKIDDGSEYIYLEWDLETSVSMSGQGRVNVETGISDTTVRYIPLS